MNKTKQCYLLLKDVLLNALNVSSEYFTPPYADIKKIDMGIRAAVWTNYNDDNSAALFFQSPISHRILIIRSNLGFYNILVTFAANERPDFISIGPFRNNELSANYFTQILKEANIEPATIQSMKSLYESMPYVQIDTVINTSKGILEYFFPEFRDVEAEVIEYSQNKRPIEIDTDVINQTFFTFSEQYRHLLTDFLNCIKSGDSNNAKKAFSSLLREFKIGPSKNMRIYKNFLLYLNDCCHLTLMHADIHPSYVLKLTSTLQNRITETVSLSKLEQLTNDICRKYCLLVKNYATPSFSKLTKDVIAYIEMHLEDELSLSKLASIFQKNASVLSTTFSRDTKQTLTSFIQSARVQEAVRLFNTTDMSVSEVAIAVGYHDFSYFSKLFSKTICMSPRAYKQKALK